MSRSALRKRRQKFDEILCMFHSWSVAGTTEDGTKTDLAHFLGIRAHENLTRRVIERTRDENSRERSLQLLKVLGQGSFGKVFLVRPLCLPGITCALHLILT